MRQKLIDLLIRHEGLRLMPYKCPAGKLTIGVGHNIEDNGITEAEALFILSNDMQTADRELAEAFAWYPLLSDVRRAAMIDLAINMGMPTLQTFRKTMAFMRTRDYAEAAAELLRGTGAGGKSRYYLQVGQRAETIAAMIKSGEWQT